ncbi:MAG: YbjQ family protein [Lachnospiraceae bacterium]|nr:YbjQ family protein [Lachnospiraceae bacterium]
MENIKLTTSSGFEGYQIVEYLGVVNGQCTLSSNFFKDMSMNFTEWSTQESTKFTEMLESASDNAVERLVKAAEKKGANAIIGLKQSYAAFASNTIGTVASGTAVVIRQKEAIYQNITATEIVSNYYNLQMPRPIEITMISKNNVVSIAPIFYNYGRETVKTIRCDIAFTNYYDEKLLLQGVDFVFSKESELRLQAEFVECKLPVKDIPMIKDVKIFVRKYVTNKGVFAPDSKPLDITLSRRMLERLRGRFGQDLVERYKSNGDTWMCVCGQTNDAVTDMVCPVCGRKETDLKVDVGFDYEEMCNRMKEMPNVSAMKDILMGYIREGSIDNKYRMELLQVMESGLQYEKTRGDMRDTVLEKIIMVFEEKSV